MKERFCEKKGENEVRAILRNFPFVSPPLKGERRGRGCWRGTSQRNAKKKEEGGKLPPPRIIFKFWRRHQNAFGPSGCGCGRCSSGSNIWPAAAAATAPPRPPSSGGRDAVAAGTAAAAAGTAAATTPPAPLSPSSHRLFLRRQRL